MEIILQKDIEKLGSKGDTIKVKKGYGKNYLIPFKYAILANKSNKKNAEQNRIQAMHKESKLIEQAKEYLNTLQKAKIKVIVKASEDSEKIFGSVSSLQISQEILKSAKINILPKNIIIEKPIKVLGEHQIKIKLYKDIVANINVTIDRDK